MSDSELPLDSLQKWMQHALVFPEQVSSEQSYRIVEASPRLNGAQRLAVYQRSYYARILKCIREQFPALCYALGEELFNDFAMEYFRERPPESYTLYDLGRRFPAFLDETRPDRDESGDNREAWIDFMVDLASFERQLFVMFDAPGHEGKPFAETADPDEKLTLQPCFALGEFRYPVAWYYHEVRRNSAPGFPPQDQSLVALVRKDYITQTLPLTEPHFAFLSALDGGSSIDEALYAVSQQFQMPEETVRRSWNEPGGIRTRWIAAGLFVATD